MPDLWFVNGNKVPYDTAQLYSDARLRVLHSLRLSKHKHTIFDEAWAADEPHLRWVLSARVSEIEQWARVIQRDAE